MCVRVRLVEGLGAADGALDLPWNTLYLKSALSDRDRTGVTRGLLAAAGFPQPKGDTDLALCHCGQRLRLDMPVLLMA